MVRVWPLSACTAVTLTLATAAPDASVTLPVNTPVPPACAIRNGADVARRQAITAPRTLLRQSPTAFLNILHLPASLIDCIPACLSAKPGAVQQGRDSAIGYNTTRY